MILLVIIKKKARKCFADRSGDISLPFLITNSLKATKIELIFPFISFYLFQFIASFVKVLVW